MKTKIGLPTMYGSKVIDTDDILFVKADGSYSVVQCTNEKIMISKNLSYVQGKLTEINFIKTHRSFVVNANRVISLHRDSGGYLLLDTGDVSIPVGATSRLKIKEQLKSMFNFI
jgi:DNA-binding LytR/AlgR family response regulator